jgi:hypothetical protein
MKKNILAVLLIKLFAVFCVYGQTTAPVDLILLLDTSSNMGSSYERVNSYLTGPFLSEFLRIGDTFHLITFSETPRLDVARRITSRGDVETIIGRILLQYPVERGNNYREALAFTEQYIASLPARPKKIVLIGTGSTDINNIVASSRQRLISQNATLDFVQITPGQPLSNLPSSGRPQPARTAPARPAPATTQAPAAVTQAPATATQAPGVATQAPATATQAPAATTQAPGATTQAPAATTQAPGAATQAPGATTQAPAATTQAPGVATQAPAAATQAPGAATQAPGVATQVPGAAATQVPGAAAQEQPQVPAHLGEEPSFADTAITAPGADTHDLEDTPQADVNREQVHGPTRQAAQERPESRPARTAITLPMIIGIIAAILLILLLIIFLASRRLGSSPNRVMAAVSATKGKEDNTKFVDHSKELAKYAAVQNKQRVTPYSVRPVKTEAAQPANINPSGPLILNLHVEDQNTAIGKRNIHSLKSGYSMTVGGGKSDDFYIFLVPIPPAIGEIRRSGSQLTFVPRKPKYFPDNGPNEIRDCIGKPIRVISDKGYEINFYFEMYEDPLESLNRLLLSVKIPG